MSSPRHQADALFKVLDNMRAEELSPFKVGDILITRPMFVGTTVILITDVLKVHDTHEYKFLLLKGCGAHIEKEKAIYQLNMYIFQKIEDAKV